MLMLRKSYYGFPDIVTSYSSCSVDAGYQNLGSNTTHFCAIISRSMKPSFSHLQTRSHIPRVQYFCVMPNANIYHPLPEPKSSDVWKDQEPRIETIWSPIVKFMALVLIDVSWTERPEQSASNSRVSRKARYHDRVIDRQIPLPRACMSA